MRKIKSVSFGLLCLAIFLRANFLLAAEKNDDPRRFEEAIVAFETADKTNPPPHGAILFIGSSSIRRWTTLAQDFPEHKVINRGFGGSHLGDSVFYADRIVIPYQPKLVVMYAGGNDINFGKTPDRVLSDFKAFVKKVRAALPKTRITYISIGISPSRWKDVEQVKAANKMIADYIKSDEKLAFIDFFPSVLGSDGKPKPDIFVSDKLHMNAKGYAILTEKVRPYLK